MMEEKPLARDDCSRVDRLLVRLAGRISVRPQRGQHDCQQRPGPAHCARMRGWGWPSAFVFLLSLLGVVVREQGQTMRS